MKYLGLDFEDMSAAEDLYAAYQASVFLPKKVKSVDSQKNGGLGGIRTPGFCLAKAAIFR
jgi:hypothetical protein